MRPLEQHGPDASMSHITTAKRRHHKISAPAGETLNAHLRPEIADPFVAAAMGAPVAQWPDGLAGRIGRECRRTAHWRALGAGVRGRATVMSEHERDAHRSRIRARIANGTLPRLKGAAWAGSAIGDHRCACCHETIRAREIEYEPRDQTTVLYAHVDCFVIWLSESQLAAGSDRRPPAKMASDEPPPPASLGRTG